MTRSAETHTGDPAGDLIVRIDALEELSAIREALDGIRDDIAWWINNHRANQWLSVQPIALHAADALAAQGDHQPNDIPSPTMCDHDRTTPTPRTPSAAAPTENIDGHSHFCCDAPDLQWTGDPQFPSVECQRCGYIVADCGSVVMQSSPVRDADPDPKEQQRGLFSEE